MGLQAYTVPGAGGWVEGLALQLPEEFSRKERRVRARIIICIDRH